MRKFMLLVALAAISAFTVTTVSTRGFQPNEPRRVQGS
jgi:hypothetical protein